MIKQMIQQQGRALEATMVNAPSVRPERMDEARALLKEAVEKAQSAVVTERDKP